MRRCGSWLRRRALHKRCTAAACCGAGSPHSPSLQPAPRCSLR
ncbi:twin-arginine translocation signal domain-containing protein [Polymorphobacter arshaanensis]|uniref:Twin-arginine translocation signal domain-containing protein n=1 Tax=Glacieibacterium arshaanense TaxID=2511025 RepID=A0A4Y9ERD8_9SPHN|nr:twin-arginine translocation signal domain-containing protein [Polymorphobacter arshaanensis]